MLKRAFPFEEAFSSVSAGGVPIVKIFPELALLPSEQVLLNAS